MKIRPTTSEDIPALQEVLRATGLFPADMLPELLAGFFAGEGADIWLTCHAGGAAIGFLYAVPEEMTEGTWNMRAIAVLPGLQGQGCGAALTRHLEDTLRAGGQRVLIVDTSGTDAFARTRAFYRHNGYAEEARIRAFWAEGDDKVTFWKALT